MAHAARDQVDEHRIRSIDQRSLPLFLLEITDSTLGLLCTMIERLLSLTIIPIQRPRNTVHPVFALPIQRQDAGKRKSRSRNGHVVAGFEFGSVKTSAKKKCETT